MRLRRDLRVGAKPPEGAVPPAVLFTAALRDLVCPGEGGVLDIHEHGLVERALEELENHHRSISDIFANT